MKWLHWRINFVNGGRTVTELSKSTIYFWNQITKGNVFRISLFLLDLDL